MPKDPYQQYLAMLAKKRQPAVDLAQRLLEEDRYDQAEQAIRAADDSIYGAVAIAKLYREWLSRLVAEGRVQTNRARVETVFHRAEYWAHSAYPEPHTEVEAENYASGQADDTRELVKILGYHPGKRS